MLFKHTHKINLVPIPFMLDHYIMNGKHIVLAKTFTWIQRYFTQFQEKGS